jgi:hypothetical protein
MVTDQLRIKSLYAGLYRTIILLVLLMAAAWLFALFSYYLSRKTGTDWFTRSGSMMGLIGAAITFRQVNFYQSALATALNEGLLSIRGEIELRLKPPHILPDPFVPRLSNRNHRYPNLGLRGPTAPTRSLNQTPRRKTISHTNGSSPARVELSGPGFTIRQPTISTLALRVAI